MNKLVLFLTLLMSGSIMAQITTPAPSPLCKIEQKVGLSTVSIEYSRPSVRNRKIFGDLVPYGKVWRTGANMATKFTISDDITVEGKKLPKGSYSLYTVPGEEEWDIIFYNEVNISGVPKVMDQAKETARIKVKAELLTYTTETFLIDINSVNQDNASMNIMWENTIVPIHLQFDVDSRVMKNIDKVLAGPSSDDYYQAARYYFDSGKDLTQAVGWIQKANQMDAKYWKLRVESMILAKLGRKSEAIEAAMKSKTMAAAEGNEEYVRMNEDAIKELTK
ncbi:MAG TPA: DUF2911 domain-containing protein [Saprospiraceae bacterium]|nr:DUF2911 domain-containing protein [Saprospiraceae bacterium]